MQPATVSFLVACALIQALPTQGAFTPARLRSGPVPPLPALVTGGGQVALELTVNPDGRVAAVTPLVTTPPFTDFMVRAVRDWQFQPAEVETEAERGAPASARSRQRVASKVLAVGVFRQPTLVGPTIGETTERRHTTIRRDGVPGEYQHAALSRHRPGSRRRLGRSPNRTRRTSGRCGSPHSSSAFRRARSPGCARIGIPAGACSWKAGHDAGVHRVWVRRADWSGRLVPLTTFTAETAEFAEKTFGRRVLCEFGVLSGCRGNESVGRGTVVWVSKAT